MPPPSTTSSRPQTSSSRPQTTTSSRQRTTSGRPQTTTSGRPRTRATSTAQDEIIGAVTEGRGVSPLVGLAFVNLSTTEVVISQVFDSQSYVKTLHKLTVLDPTTVIVPEPSFSGKSKLMLVLQANLGADVTIKSAPRRIWDETTGVECIHQFAFEDEIEAVKVASHGSFFAICCLAAVFTFIDCELGISFSANSIRMRFEPSEGSMMIDLSTIKSLELIQNLADSRSKECLFGLMNSTFTPMGSRLLRANLLQPLTEKRDIERRWDAVDDLHARQEVFVAVRKALKGSLDLDKVLTEFVTIPSTSIMSFFEQSVNNVLLLKQCIRSVGPLFEALSGARSDLLQQIRQYLVPDAVANVSTLIDESINEDATWQKKPLDMFNQRIYAVKAGFNGLLDVARQTFTEASRDAQSLAEELSTTYELNFDLKYDTTRRHFLTIPASELADRQLPEVFVHMYRKNKVVECSTLDLVKLNQKIVDAHHEVLEMSNSVVRDLIEGIRADIAPLFRISDSVALLDMLAAFAHSATTHDYCRPELLNTFAIKGGRHPILEQIQQDRFVANDVFANRTSRLQLITGANMSGKSTYIRSIALITIMAQVGSFVPANYASVPIRHQLFARLSLDDSSAAGISTFAEEMRAMAFILQHVDERTLVLVDELGRGTSTADGLAIALAIVEALVQARAFVWFVTHFQELTQVLAERPGLVARHLQVDIQQGVRISMLYKVANGATPAGQNHGLVLAAAAGFPDDILQRATIASNAIAKRKERKAELSQSILQARRAKLLLNLKEQLIQARDGNLAGENLTQWLKHLQDEFTRRMSALDEELERVTVASSEWMTDRRPSPSVSDALPQSTSNPSPARSNTRPGSDGRFMMCGAL